jgi:hypothetical protein
VSRKWTTITIKSASFDYNGMYAPSAFDAKAFMRAMVMPKREWEVGFPFLEPSLQAAVGEIVTITLPEWEFRVQARIVGVSDKSGGLVVRFSEIDPA